MTKFISFKGCFYSFAIITITLLLAPAVSNAQPSGFYMAGYLGLNIADDSNVNAPSVPQGSDLEFETSASFAGALGFKLGTNFRLEAELSYRSTDFNQIEFQNGSALGIDGDLNTTLLMLNGQYDFDLEWDYLTPYVSAGIGLAYHNSDINSIGGLAINSTDDELGLAWQIGTGLRYQLNDAVSLTGGYRYLSTSDIGDDGIDFDFNSHELRLGLEYELPTGFLE